MANFLSSFSVAVSLLTGAFWSSRTSPLVVKVNEGDSLLSVWPSESYDSPVDSAPECRFWNRSVVYESTLCSHLAVSRPSSSPSRALQRALSCAAVFETECVLSPEIGLSVPALFVNSHASADMIHMIAPKILEREEAVYVKIAAPDGASTTETRSMSRRVRVEYLDGKTRRMKIESVTDETAFCVQLLRSAFSEACWQKID